jgi:hypothetical protein
MPVQQWEHGAIDSMSNAWNRQLHIVQQKFPQDQQQHVQKMSHGAVPRL